MLLTFPGAYTTLCLWKTAMAALSVGMLAPSATSFTPDFTSASASSLPISFWVAQGRAMSYLVSAPHGFLPSTYLPVSSSLSQ